MRNRYNYPTITTLYSLYIYTFVIFSLFDVPSEVYEYPTIFAIRALYDNYEHNSTIKENRTDAKRKEEDLLLDVFLNTNVMARAMKWLSIRGFIDSDDFERKDTLRHIWFSQFDGATSGFERVFTSERYGYDLLGVQDWIYFAYQESKNRIDYKGYVETLKLGNVSSILHHNIKKKTNVHFFNIFSYRNHKKSFLSLI